MVANSKGRIYEIGKKLSEVQIKEINLYLEANNGDVNMVANKLRYSRKTITKYLFAKKLNKLGRPKLTTRKHNSIVLNILKLAYDEEPQLLLKEVKEIFENELNLELSLSTISKYCTEIGYDRKRATIISYYRTLPRIQELREKFRGLVVQNHYNSYVFIDESHFSSKV
jgi:transposase